MRAGGATARRCETMAGRAHCARSTRFPSARPGKEWPWTGDSADGAARKGNPGAAVPHLPGTLLVVDSPRCRNEENNRVSSVQPRAIALLVAHDCAEPLNRASESALAANGTAIARGIRGAATD